MITATKECKKTKDPNVKDQMYYSDVNSLAMLVLISEALIIVGFRTIV